MIKAVFLIHKRPDMNDEAFRRYWRETHGPIAAKIPGLRKYVQCPASAEPDGTAPVYDGFAEMWFDSRESFDQGFASPEGKAALDDAGNFIDMSRLQSLTVQEIPIV